MSGADARRILIGPTPAPLGEADLIRGKHRDGPTKTLTVAHQLHFSRFTNLAN
jgi:replicative DNA helicase